jgi:hypothetical protein
VEGSGQSGDVEPAAEIASSVAVANLPWAFSQSHPLTTKDFIDEAKKRGFELDLSALRELYRHQLIVPFVYVGPHQVAELPDSIADEPPSHGTTLTELRIGRSRGRLIDLAAHPFKPRLRFEKPGAGRWWWNGLIYSRYQPLALQEARSVLNKRKPFRRSGRRITGQTSATRGQSIIHSYGESVDFAGFVSLSAKATYGDITSVTWHAASSGCSSPNSRLLWGNGYTVPNAPIVQANCFVRPSP